jgi:riboflavin transporter FmnP
MNNDNKGWACLGVSLFAVLSVVIGVIMRGWMLSVLWGWFVIPLFESAPQLTIVTAIGLSTVLGAFMGSKYDSNNSKKSTSELAVELITYSILVPLFTVGFGYVIHLFM